jgi:hypothetical protein
MGYLMRIGVWATSPSGDWATEPHFVRILIARRPGQAVVPSFHSVTGHLQILEGTIMDAM